MTLQQDELHFIMAHPYSTVQQQELAGPEFCICKWCGVASTAKSDSPCDHIVVDKGQEGGADLEDHVGKVKWRRVQHQVLPKVLKVIVDSGVNHCLTCEV